MVESVTSGETLGPLKRTTGWKGEGGGWGNDKKTELYDFS